MIPNVRNATDIVLGEETGRGLSPISGVGAEAVRALTGLHKALIAGTLSLGIGTSAIADDTRVSPVFDEGGSYRVADSGIIKTDALELDTANLPGDELLFTLYPVLEQFPYEVIAKFRKDFETLGESKPDYVEEFLSLSQEGMRFMMSFYQQLSQDETIDPYDIITYGIHIPMIRSNVEYVIMHNGDVRDGDATNIVDVVLEAQEYIPASQRILDVEYMEYTLALYQKAKILVLARLEESNARLEESNSRLEESNSRLEESNARLEESNARLEESKVRLEESNARLEKSIAVGKKLDEEIQRLNSVIEMMKGVKISQLSN